MNVDKLGLGLKIFGGCMMLASAGLLAWSIAVQLRSGVERCGPRHNGLSVLAAEGEAIYARSSTTGECYRIEGLGEPECSAQPHDCAKVPGAAK